MILQGPEFFLKFLENLLTVFPLSFNRIISHQKKYWPQLKEKTYLAVYHADSGKMVPLADKEVPEVEIPENSRFALGFSNVPYLKVITWDGNYDDIWLIDLAMRRLGKDCILLQYRGEPHHPRKYANKLDYAIRMKEYLDHCLKAVPAPDWISQGIPYRGK
jgi:hypothetical protein